MWSPCPRCSRCGSWNAGSHAAPLPAGWPRGSAPRVPEGRLPGRGRTCSGSVSVPAASRSSVPQRQSVLQPRAGCGPPTSRARGHCVRMKCHRAAAPPQRSATPINTDLPSSPSVLVIPTSSLPSSKPGGALTNSVIPQQQPVVLALTSLVLLSKYMTLPLNPD